MLTLGIGTLSSCATPSGTAQPRGSQATLAVSPLSSQPKSSPGPAVPTQIADAPATIVGQQHPVIVIDPGHSPAIQSIDPATGLQDSDYENEPEMKDVFTVAMLVKHQLELDGYTVVMTKTQVTDRVSLGARATIANNAHAALAISIHDQAGPGGGIAFATGNNAVYYQSTGTYRSTPSGKRITFTNAALASASRSCALLMQAARSRQEGHPVQLMGNVGYDLESRGLAPGNIWMVQLLSQVPWIYDEAGGNSGSMTGLDATDRQEYAAGLAAGVQACVPLPK